MRARAPGGQSSPIGFEASFGDQGTGLAIPRAGGQRRPKCGLAGILQKLGQPALGWRPTAQRQAPPVAPGGGPFFRLLEGQPLAMGGEGGV